MKNLYLSREIQVVKEGAKQRPWGSSSRQKGARKLHHEDPVPGVVQARGRGVGEVEKRGTLKNTGQYLGCHPKREASEGS